MNSLAHLYRLLSDSASTNKTAMCLRSSIDRFAIPCIYEVEGIITMPVCCPSIVQHLSLVSRLTATGTRTPLPRLLGAWRHRLGHPRQMLPAVRHTCQLNWPSLSGMCMSTMCCDLSLISWLVLGRVTRFLPHSVLLEFGSINEYW